ncbi:zinc finger BED domain-containing protein RICESLEEPER 1-like [Ipomoea triloba]|uniref:zinc finger BED domain-containing protein RICESLEEPER 1-like n=1 Tax=Ipomoea triloba TaxID=35885 RepID=UPI00125D9EBA|nr:zinc finger BED domain-containing protein RICESLEEPER 1-like [Ipomoea triloba]
MIVRIHGSLYVTSNSFFYEISNLSCMLDDMIGSDTSSEKAMRSQMKQKFQKYWRDLEKMNFLIFYANILDLRDKIEYMPSQFAQLYGEEKDKSCFAASMVELFNDYAATYLVTSSTVTSVQFEPVHVHSQTSVRKPQSRLKSQLKKQRMESGGE